ncbi:YraN family protein [Dendrosporobacter sp. 1207_IL3150]|uniref:YraN family protein n=1 Tax=Dendrosporobacter sp. 1207_IL3150 TaxID=3084054 RepID=UPI002FDADDC4
MNHIALGELGEKAAISYLETKGYTVLVHKYRTKTGEIDIIAGDGGVIVFVEVKTRRNNAYGLPCESVNYRKQRKIIKTAQWYLNHSGAYDSPCRFDILEIIITNLKEKPCINHIIHAFGE